MILLIDNYDSFSYNLYQMVGGMCPDIKVIRNDECTVREIESMAPARIIISPGPGRPDQAGVCEEAVTYFQDKLPILGVCLGHQAICEAFGATVSHAKRLMHGKMSVVKLDTGCSLFAGMEGETQVARYHSLAVQGDTIPDSLRVIAAAQDGEVMAVKHNQYEVYGVQFHPESILTPEGNIILKNFLDIAL